MRTQQLDTDPVAEFYTAHPYPPPVENLDRARDAWRDENRRRAEYHLFWPTRPYRADLEILVAGCGTWQAAKYALGHPGARVTGIDLSPTSLDHTERLKRKYDLTNLETRRMAIEQAGELGGRFDLIVCTGVLHHLAHPDDGLRALRSALKPGGALYLMVYAHYGRAGIYLLQDYCRRLGVGTSIREINDLAGVVEALPPQHPLVILLHGARDALNADALADALLNPRDRSYTVPELYELLDRNGMVPGRWYWQAPYSPRCGAIATTPHAERLSSLREREQHAAMELWRGMMTTHSLITYPRDAGGSLPTPCFEGERWPGYVPLRLPDTLCVSDRCPPGAVGVLLNRNHAFHDLVLTIDAWEMRLLERIDGRHNIAELVDDPGNRVGDPRAFFEKLWRYDQVVFDRSTTCAPEKPAAAAGGKPASGA